MSHAAPHGGPSVRYGDKFVILGTANASMTRTGPEATRLVGHVPEKAVRLSVHPALAHRAVGDLVLLDEPCYVRAVEDGMYLERTTLMYSDREHGAGRFKLGFREVPTQLATFTRCDAAVMGKPFSFGEGVGLSFAGSLPGRERVTDPRTSTRRLVTLRHDDQPNCVVDWYRGHERLTLVRNRDDEKGKSASDADPDASESS